MKPDYKEFAKDLLEVCVKHGVSMVAEKDGKAFIIPSESSSMTAVEYDRFSINIIPKRVEFGYRFDDNYLRFEQ